MNFKKLGTIGIFLGMIILLCTACTKENKSNSKISIVSSTNVYADIAKNIVGKYGISSAIIKSSSVDPHDFEPKTSDAKDLKHADIIIANGMDYDGWMKKLAKANGKKITRVGEDLMHLKTDANPHIWYNLKMPQAYVKYLVKRLSTLDKKHSAYYKNNAQKYLKKIAKIQKIANNIKTVKKPVLVSEPVFDYALIAAGYKIGNPEFEEAVEKETDPSPKIIKHMNKMIATKKIAFFVNNTQVNSATINSFIKKAKANKIPILKVRETIPNDTTYFDWMLTNYQNLAKISK